LPHSPLPQGVDHQVPTDALTRSDPLPRRFGTRNRVEARGVHVRCVGRIRAAARHGASIPKRRSTGFSLLVTTIGMLVVPGLDRLLADLDHQVVITDHALAPEPAVGPNVLQTVLRPWLLLCRHHPKGVARSSSQLVPLPRRLPDLPASVGHSYSPASLPSTSPCAPPATVA